MIAKRKQRLECQYTYGCLFDSIASNVCINVGRFFVSFASLRIARSDHLDGAGWFGDYSLPTLVRYIVN
eukprot:6285394-Amphidinium_carterae.1